MTGTQARWYPSPPPAWDGEDDEAYSVRLLGGPATSPYDHYRRRQCSLGYHTECSQRHAAVPLSSPAPSVLTAPRRTIPAGLEWHITSEEGTGVAGIRDQILQRQAAAAACRCPCHADTVPAAAAGLPAALRKAAQVLAGLYYLPETTGLRVMVITQAAAASSRPVAWLLAGLGETYASPQTTSFIVDAARVYQDVVTVAAPGDASRPAPGAPATEEDNQP